jgi:hypothetical protein
MKLVESVPAAVCVAGTVCAASVVAWAALALCSMLVVTAAHAPVLRRTRAFLRQRQNNVAGTYSRRQCSRVTVWHGDVTGWAHDQMR